MAGKIYESQYTILCYCSSRTDIDLSLISSRLNYNALTSSLIYIQVYIENLHLMIWHIINNDHSIFKYIFVNPDGKLNLNEFDLFKV